MTRFRDAIRRILSDYRKATGFCTTATSSNARAAGEPKTPTICRQTFDAHGSQMCAQLCHAVFDLPGFAFGNYDGAGRFRTTDNGFPVAATGSFRPRVGRC
jgi:hypothetical protein